ncbi:IS200/IS605 family transposase [Leptolyngbya sp. AN02str]|uniref:IS200/IS605 family transposase n=1 Tax=Leptolyngbya sp. AN02str TaxID=3423363 RepID=UPI003D314C91
MSIWRTYYHLVWATRDRIPSITDTVAPELYRYIQAKAESLDCSLHALGGVADHIHLIVSIPPKHSIAFVVKRMRGGSSRHISTEFPGHRLAWQREYGAFSLGGKQLPDAIAYVENQPHHHATQTLIASLEPEAFAPAPKLPNPFQWVALNQPIYQSHL